MKRVTYYKFCRSSSEQYNGTVRVIFLLLLPLIINKFALKKCLNSLFYISALWHKGLKGNPVLTQSVLSCWVICACDMF